MACFQGRPAVSFRDVFFFADRSLSRVGDRPPKGFGDPENFGTVFFEYL